MISNTIKALPLTGNKQGAWKNKVANSINSSNVIGGDGIRIEYGPNGAVVSLDVIDESRPVTYVGDFDMNREYFVNQMVRVRPDVQYMEITNTPLTSSTTDVPGIETFPITPGLYICTSYVPPGACDETWFDTVATPLYPNGVPFSVVQGTRWNTYNVYWPQYPECPSQYTASVVTSEGYNIIANKCFWNAMPVGLRLVQGDCNNGVTSNLWVAGYEVGKQFLPEYLPYQP